MTPAADPACRIGVDIGGTFTDLVVADERGAVRVFKVPTVPSDPAQGAFNALSAAAVGFECTVSELLSRTALFVHGSTIATNTVLEQSGARVGMLVSEGFRDALEIRRGLRDNPWDHRLPYPPVLVPRYLRRPLGGRIDSRGRELEALRPEDVEAAAALFELERVDAVAVALFNSYLNPAQEDQAAAELARHWNGSWVTRSAAIAPVMGEFERASTAVLNAYIAPRTVTYLKSLNRRLLELGLKKPLLLIQSNGGAISVEQVAERPVTLLLSGPAAGVGALVFYSRAIGSDNLISMEIGGTSCDVLLMSGGRVALSDSLSIGGYDAVSRSVDVHSIGAGGGTIARVVEGLLTVGPQGAGAIPGPACYGRGGAKATVTDAQVVLGRLRPSAAEGKVLQLDSDEATLVIEREVALPLGIGCEAAASGIVRLMEQKLLHAVQRLSVERGYDPRKFTLVAAGGAGPMHGAEVGRLLGCRKVYIPRLAGAFCALGMLHADVRHDYVRMQLGDLDAIASERVADTFRTLEEEARTTLEQEGFTSDDSVFSRLVDLRYESQQWDITVALSEPGWNTARIREDFEAEHRRQYGHVQPGGVIRLTRQRVAATGRLPPLSTGLPEPGTGEAAPAGHRRVWLDTEAGWVDTPVFEGRTLRAGHSLSGPAVIDEHTTTVLVGQTVVQEGTGKSLQALGIKLVSMTPSEGIKMPAGLDAAAVWVPIRFMDQSLGTASLLIDSSGFTGPAHKLKGKRIPGIEKAWGYPEGYLLDRLYLCARREFGRDNPDLLVAFLRARIEAQRLAVADRAKSLDVANATWKLDPGVAAKARDTYPENTDVRNAPFVLEGDALAIVKGSEFFASIQAVDSPVSWADVKDVMMPGAAIQKKAWEEGSMKPEAAAMEGDFKGSNPTWPELNITGGAPVWAWEQMADWGQRKYKPGPFLLK